MWTGNQTGTAAEIHVELLPVAVAGGILTGLFWAVLSTILLCFFEHLTTVTIRLSLPLTTRMNPNGNPNYRHCRISAARYCSSCTMGKCRDTAVLPILLSKFTIH